MGPARLAILVAGDRRRGAEVFGETLAQGLAAAGWHTDLLALATAAEEPRISARPLSAFTPETLPRLDRDLVGTLRRWAAEHRPDVVLANGSSTMQYAVAALRPGFVSPVFGNWARSRPRLVYVSIGDPMYWVRGTGHRLLRTAILKGVDRVLSVSAVTAGTLASELGVPPDKIRIAPTGVPDRFFTIEKDRSGRSDGDPLRVVFIGNLSEEKDPLTAVDVLSRLAAVSPVSARFLGGGPLRATVAAAVTVRGLDGSVEVLGSVPDVAPHLAWADVLLMTSHSEGLPGAPLEAGAAGVPSVVFDVGGSSETVVDGATGRVVAAGDVGAAVAALAALAADRGTLEVWGGAAREMVSDRFGLDRALARYGDLLDDELAIGRRGRAS
jgi:glycosyltransferase involved in cell wall biosynthesis